jgi:hypothetical protein
MSAKLTENDWRQNSARCKFKNTELQGLLADYDDLGDDEHDELLDKIAEIKKLALEVKKSREITANPAAAKYLGEIVAAADAEQREVSKDKTEAEKAAKKSNVTANKADTSDNGDGEPFGKDSPVGKLLLLALQKLKSDEDLEYEFIVCDAKPQPAVMIAKKITAQHKTLLTDATGGSKKFLHVGLCWFEDGHVVFEPETPTSGLVPKLKLALHHHTGKKHAVRIGEESSEEEPAPAASPRDVASGGKAVAEAAAAPNPVPELAKAPDTWKGTCDTLLEDIRALGKAVRAQCANEPAEFTKEINGYMEKLESRIEKFGLKLSNSLVKANDAKDAAGRKAELTNAKAIVAQTIKDVKPLAVVVDENPFVKTNFTGELTGGLTRAAQAITKGLAA